MYLTISPSSSSFILKHIISPAHVRSSVNCEKCVAWECLIFWEAVWWTCSGRAIEWQLNSSLAENFIMIHASLIVCIYHHFCQRRINPVIVFYYIIPWLNLHACSYCWNGDFIQHWSHSILWIMLCLCCHQFFISYRF